MPTSNTTKSAAAVGILALIASIGVIVNNLSRADEAKFAWDQSVVLSDASGNVKTLTQDEVNTKLKFKVYVDSSTSVQDLNNVACTPTNDTVYICAVELKSLNLTPTIHSLQLTTVFDGVESEKSLPLEVNFLVTTNK